MLITDPALQAVDKHWAVIAVGADRRDRGLEVAQARLIHSAVGQQMTLDFQEQPVDAAILEKLSLAYELAAIEGIEATLYPAQTDEGKRLREQCLAGAWRAFEIRRLMPIPADDVARVFAVLHLASLAYSADRWTDLRRWLGEHGNVVVAPSVDGAPWDRRLLFRLFDCWTRLLRKRSWDDLSQIAVIVVGLRQDQSLYEPAMLNNGTNAADQAMALRLVALYHWAKATELLATYVIQGTPAGVSEELDKHFEASRKAAAATHDAAFEMLQQWLHLTARRMVVGSVWWVARAVNSRVTQFIENVTKSSRPLFELLPPQRAAIQEQGLLDQAHRAIVVDLPTSGGKTLLAEFRMLQALNQFSQDKGWVAYIAPTRALVAQVTRRLRRDFGPLGLVVEQLTGAVEIDAFEDAMLSAAGDRAAFDVLVATPEKLQLVLRNKTVARPLALVVTDEAHNIEDGERGMRIELLLATIRRECEKANFLLLMPLVPNAEDLARWLAPDSGTTVSIGTSPWKPNDRIVGLYHAERGTARGDWALQYETLVPMTHKVVQLRGTHTVGGNRPLGLSWSKAASSAAQTGSMATIMSSRGTSVAVADTIPHVWSMARTIAKGLPPLSKVEDDVALVQRFLATEISPQFELIEMLSRGIGVHHAGISDEARSLIEWLAEEGHLKVLCATTTIAQGINFPVSSVFLSSINHPLSHPPYHLRMTPREFWNLAGRAGRIGQDSVGVVGIVAGKNPNDLKQFVSVATGALVSRLVQLLDGLYEAGKLNQLDGALAHEDWRDFRCYIAHLWAEKKNLDLVLADTEQLLRHTYGYAALRSQQTLISNVKADALLDVTKRYVQKLSLHPENASLADSTGFAPEGVRSALLGLDELQRKLTPADWEPSSLFGQASESLLPNLVGIMLHIPEIKGSLEQITSSGMTHQRIAALTTAWVNGDSIRDIAKEFFADTDQTKALSEACKAIYRTLVNSGPWGLAALSKMPTSGIDFDNLPPDVKKRLNAIPSMIYHGVRTESAVLMRMNAVPRSIAEALGAKLQAAGGGEQSVKSARDFLRSLNQAEWDTAVPVGASMSGSDYRRVWKQLSGELAN